MNSTPTAHPDMSSLQQLANTQDPLVQNETFENNNTNEEYANDQDISNIPDVESNNDLNKENTSNEATAPSISEEERRKRFDIGPENDYPNRQR